MEENPEQKYFDTGVIMIDSDYLMEKKEKKRYVKGLSSTDALTGILNRRAFQVELEEQIRKKEPGFFIFIDVDNFKSYNDTYGHNNGDLCLKHSPKQCRNVSRKEVYLAGMVEMNSWSI